MLRNLLAGAALFGCATVIDEHRLPPAGWPKLEVRDNVISGWQVQVKCYMYLPLAHRLLGGIALACAEVNFRDCTCNIWRAWDASEEILLHERLHCLGYSHYGETWAEDLLNEWRGK